jgi:prepilin-type N-terminal cleavage/methylation domain-containing protein
MKTNVQTTRRGFTLVELLVVIVIIASLAGLTAPMVIRQRKKADQTEAISNAKQIGLAMFEFETEYGSFPDASTAATVTANTGTAYVMPATNSNGIFRQLFGAGYTQSEAMFYAKTQGTKKPDGNIVGEAALAAGEVGFAYITVGVSGLSTSGNPARPYVVTPLLGATDNFDPNPFDSKAVVLRVDNSVSSLQILPTGVVNLSPNQPLLTANATSVWGAGGGQPALIKPELKP